jgi:hypothetical protein
LPNLGGGKGTVKESNVLSTLGGFMKMKTKMSLKDPDAQSDKPSAGMNLLSKSLGMKIAQQIKKEQEEAQPPLVTKETVMP